MKTYAVIIKHPGRDNDWRIDVFKVEEKTTPQELHDYVMSRMLGPFQVIAITEKLSSTTTLIRTLTEKNPEPIKEGESI